MRTNAFHGNKGPCLGHGCSFTSLCVLFSDRESGRRFAPPRGLVDIGHTSTVLRHACPSRSMRSIIEFLHFAMQAQKTCSPEDVFRCLAIRGLLGLWCENKSRLVRSSPRDFGFEGFLFGAVLLFARCLCFGG
jgi:hypothetical protein